MKIVKLTSENVKRLKAVEITPDGTLQVISGKNGQGKSSVLDSIWLALGGGAAKKGTARPIRDGADNARVELDLGDLVVTRTWSSNDRSTLKVTSKDGAQYKSPQAMLDSLIGRLSFDPLAFTQLSGKEQREQLISLVDLSIDVDELDRERARLFDERTQVGREGKALGDVSVDPTLPEVETSAVELIRKIDDAQQLVRVNHAWRAKRADLTDEVAKLTRLLSEAQSALAEAESVELEPEPDINAMRARLASLEEENARIRANNTARETEAKKMALREKYKALTDAISIVDEKKAEALAKAVFPVDGLGFDADGVTYQGVPFSQASAAEQIRVSLAMAMAMNPKLRVIRIMDGSLLDSDNMQLIAQMAADNDFQVWVERVADGDGAGVVIEDGEVAK
ncbi:AAA family ATPase [Trueperella pyogenes]|uniref:AAA family ATPase n=1 Tax=Trueperella pyogenes TaxID=1661 RepID=UPI0032492A27